MTLLDVIELWWWGVVAASIAAFSYSFYTAGRKAAKRAQYKNRLAGGK